MTSSESVIRAPAAIETDGCAWIDGNYVPISEARISVLDTGFARSDLTYDVVAVWAGRFFRLEDHLDRFEKSCHTLRLKIPISREEVREIVIEVARRSGLREAYVQMIATRGVPPTGERDPRRLSPRFYAYAIPYIWIVRPDQQQTGIKAIVARGVRRVPPGAIDPTVKNLQWGDFIRGLFEAYDRDALLPLLTDGDGNITEGPGFNLFAVKDNQLYTPARGVLLGITRQTVIDIATEQGLSVVVDDVPTNLLYGADELFLTSTSGGVMPIAELDEQPVGTGRPGLLTTRLRETYWAWHEDDRFTTPVPYDS